ncbi:MAG: hypothetical protein AB8F94_19480 [Saprospiraceae bacterium]
MKTTLQLILSTILVFHSIIVYTQSSDRNYTDFASMHDSLGVLILDTTVPELSNSHELYIFTKEDALWMARFVTGEAGVKTNEDGYAVLWAMFNKFGILRHRVKKWTSFGAFLQQYSTTLQPIIKSKGAAQRLYRKYEKNPNKFPIKTFKGFYKNSEIPKLQSVKHLKLRRKKWEDIHPKIQIMVIDILLGEIKNPGVGIATEFAGTHIYYKQKHKKKPNHEEWEEYTIQLAQKKKWTWVGEKTNLNQQTKNAFFIDNRFINVPEDAIWIDPVY